VSQAFYVYIVANVRGRRPVLYISVTNDILRPIAEHRSGQRGFAGRYKVTTLVYLERINDVQAAIVREKAI